MQLDILASKIKRLEYAARGTWGEESESQIAYHEASEKYCGVPLPEWVAMRRGNPYDSVDAMHADMKSRRKFFTGSEELTP